MKILFDHQIFQSQRFGGISRYFAETLPRLTEEKDLEISLFLGRSINQYGLQDQYQKFKSFRGGMMPSWQEKLKLGTKLNRLEFPLYSKLQNPDLVHFTYYRDTNPSFKGVRTLTVYDMIHELKPDEFGPGDATAEWKRVGVSKAQQIIVISESTKKDLVRLMNVPEDRVKVIYLANSLTIKPLEKSPLARPYILFVGLRGGYKNFDLFLKAVSESRYSKDFDIYCFGGPAFSQGEISLISKLGFSDRIHRKSGGDLDLATAYQHAHFFAFPSLYEGFGIPPLEAMNYGCPVLSANVSSVPEVVGDAALQVQAQDLGELKKGIESLVENQELRKRLIEKGHQRTKEFSWDRCAKEHALFYRQLI